MGTIIYGHLSESILLDSKLIASEFQNVSDQELKNALRKYREFCIDNLKELTEEVAPEKGKIRLYVGDNANLQMLKQGAFYLDSVIIADPLFKMTSPEDSFASILLKTFDMHSANSFSRKSLVSAVKYLVACRPLVTNGYVRFYPSTYQEEEPQEIPIYVPDDGFEGVLPAHVLAHYKKAANVRSVVSSPKGLLIMPNLELGRWIHIDFDGLNNGRAFGFNLAEQEVVSWDRESRRGEMAIRLPKNLPSQQSFDNWKAQSVNSAALMHFMGLSQDIRLSKRFGSQYMTRSRFNASILDSTKSLSASNIASETTNGWLNADLPCFENVSMKNLMAARSNEESFKRFRLQLEKHFRELRLETDFEKRRLKTENAIHELAEIQLTEVDSAIRRLKRKGILSGLGTVASLVAATWTSGASILGAMGAAYAGIKALEEYRIAAKESPAYFLWQASNRNRNLR